jgi:hypothetical protein
VLQRIVIEQYRAIYPYAHVVTKIIAEPLKSDMYSDAYLKVKHSLGDDWVSDITDTWFDGALSPKQAIKLDSILKNLSV